MKSVARILVLIAIVFPGWVMDKSRGQRGIAKGPTPIGDQEAKVQTVKTIPERSQAVVLRVEGLQPMPGNVVDLVIQINDLAESSVIFPGVMVITSTHVPAGKCLFALSPEQTMIVTRLKEAGITCSVQSPRNYNRNE